MYIFCYILGLIVVLTAIPVEAGDYCSYRYRCYDIFGSYSYCYKYTYCDYGCCGSSYSDSSEVCCTNNLPGIIAGAVIGGLIVLGVVIALIVYCCVYAHNSGKHRGAVILPMNTTQIRTVTATTAAIAPGPSSHPSHYGPVIYGPPADQQVPPPYTPFNTGTSGVTEAAYPPPPPPKYY